jgi:alpha-L-fucosidase 2
MTRSIAISMAVSVALGVLTSCTGAQTTAAPKASAAAAPQPRRELPPLKDATLWYPKPAAKWEEALPVGSGRLGAMVFGGTASERIQFNEDTLWTGRPDDYVRDGAGDHLKELQALVFAGKSAEAADLFRKTMISDPIRQKAYQPFGDLRLKFPAGEATDYRRDLNLDTAIATTTYTAGGVRYTREVFASYPDNAIVVRITADQPGKVGFDLQMDSPHTSIEMAGEGSDTLVLRGKVRDLRPRTPAESEDGMRFESRVRVIPTGGTVKVSGDAATQPARATATVANADSVTLVLVAATEFVNWQKVGADPAARCAAYLAKLAGRSYDDLRSRHLADFQPLMRRVTIDLGAGDEKVAAQPTDQRINAVRKAGNPGGSAAKNPDMPDRIVGGLDADPKLASLFFQYGRYMLITASRPGTQPANLQGVWNELKDPPWESKYTTNINYEMNYWPAEVTNLSETHEPFFDAIDDLRVSGAITAKKQYHAGGWVLHHNTDLWRGTAPINNIDGMWPTGGAWLVHHMWEHYQFTGNKEFLEKRAYPAMKEAAQFFVDFLVKDPKSGYLVTNPSHSPEQGELNAGPAMDMQLIRALIDYTTEASQILGGVDKEFIAKLAEIRRQLVPMQIGERGQLLEWQVYPGEQPKWVVDLSQPNNNHRHMSPLWGLYPGTQFTPEIDPKEWNAVKTLLKDRGDGSTGWSFVWRIPLWARAGDGDYAYRQLALTMARRVLPNLFDLCGPYQADGNYGVAGGLPELFIQSHLRAAPPPAQHYVLDLLPALPEVWPSGTVTGLRARGGFEVDLTWKDRKVDRVTVRSLLGNPLRVRAGGKTLDLTTTKGETITLDGTLARQ